MKADAVPGSRTQRFDWDWQGTDFTVGYDVRGQGAPVLLLPAFSTVSSRDEMAELAGLLAPRFQTIAVDWPGFGGDASPKSTQSPELHLDFLAAFVDHLQMGALAVIAAGHAAAYVLRLARSRPPGWTRIVLVAPTWRGPLPTMMNGTRPIQGRILAAIRNPVIGPALYWLNVSRPVIRMMYRRHVYADASRVTAGFVERKRTIARRCGGRFGSGAFVTGALDVVADRAAFLDLARSITVPILVVYGADTPPRSRAEMTALAELPGIQSACLPIGSLGLNEEHAGQMADLLSNFLVSP